MRRARCRRAHSARQTIAARSARPHGALRPPRYLLQRDAALPTDRRSVAAGPRDRKGGSRPAAPRGTRGKSSRADPRGGGTRTGARLAFTRGEFAAVPAPKPGLGFPLPPPPTYLRREGGGGSAPAPPARRRPPRPSALPAAAARSLRHGPPPPPGPFQFGAAILSVSPPRRASRIWAAPGRPCAPGRGRRGGARPGLRRFCAAAGGRAVNAGGCASLLRRYAALQHDSGRKIQDLTVLLATSPAAQPGAQEIQIRRFLQTGRQECLCSQLESNVRSKGRLMENAF